MEERPDLFPWAQEAKLPDRLIHRPWEATQDVLHKAGVKLGDSYPVPVIDHAEARERALGAYKSMRGTN